VKESRHAETSTLTFDWRSTPPPTVWDLLSRAARQQQDQVAIWVSGETLSFRELKDASAAFGRALIESGVAPGDRVVLLGPTSVEAIVSLFGCAFARAIFAPLSARLTARELTDALDRLEPRALVVDTMAQDGALTRLASTWITGRERGRGAIDVSTIGNAAAELAGASRSLSSLVSSRPTASDSIDDADVGDARIERASNDPFLIQMTSGSTSAPKAVLLEQGQCARMGYELGVRFDLQPGDRYFVCNPIHHVGCTNFGLLAGLSHGAGFYSLRDFDGDDAIAAIQALRCTHHHGIETHYLYEMRSPRLTPGSTSLRVATAPDDITERLLEAFGPLITVNVYGSSETTASPFCSDHRDPPELRLRTNGRALPDLEAAIVDPDTHERLPPAQLGEIVIRGWCVMRGYFGDAEATARAIDAEGWYHTGDLGSLDADGNLKFMSRIKDSFRVGGENVAAAEVESVLQSHPGVRAAAVVAMRHELLGHVPVAFIVESGRSPAPTSAELVAFCSERLAKFKVPRQIHRLTLDELPMTGPGKVKKSELIALAMRLANGSAESGPS
jgi:fatty-acyl-CoA synthase